MLGNVPYIEDKAQIDEIIEDAKNGNNTLVDNDRKVNKASLK